MQHSRSRDRHFYAATPPARNEATVHGAIQAILTLPPISTSHGRPTAYRWTADAKPPAAAQARHPRLAESELEVVVRPCRHRFRMLVLEATGGRPLNHL